MTALPQLLTEDEAAAILHLSTRTLRSLRRQGLIRYIALTARNIRYRRDDCEEYLLSQVVQPTLPRRELPASDFFPKVPCVYFVRSGKNGPIKIGCAKHLRARLHSLRTAQHEELILLATMAGGVVQERRLHKQFDAHRIRGEWFEPAEELLIFIETIRGTISA